VIEGPDAVRTVLGDQGKIRQVLINLVGNAFKFTERGHVRLAVMVSRRPTGQLWLSARVEDTGAGIAASELGQLFKPFTQTQSGMRLQSGTGLGLAISSQYARLMGGQITVSSDVATGTVCLFEIPVIQVDAASALSAAPTRVLIVDDEPDNRGYLMGLLTSVGFEWREAGNGEEAVRAWDSWHPQLILMDLRMPIMDGLEATRRIRQSAPGKGPVIIVLTASAMNEDRHKVLQAGADELMVKPCRDADLLETIRAHLGLVYVYADQGSEPELTSIDDSARSWNSDALDALPVEWADDLRLAIFDGDKERVNGLIAHIPQRDAAFARALQRLADRYEYDAMTQLLERTRP
jgi:CheY-like chemotaxis protein